MSKVIGAPRTHRTGTIMFTVMWTSMCQLKTAVEYIHKPLTAR